MFGYNDYHIDIDDAKFPELESAIRSLTSSIRSNTDFNFFSEIYYTDSLLQAIYPEYSLKQFAEIHLLVQDIDTLKAAINKIEVF